MKKYNGQKALSYTQGNIIRYFNIAVDIWSNIFPRVKELIVVEIFSNTYLDNISFL